MLAIFLAGFLLAALVGVVQRSDTVCGTNEDRIICLREWLAIVGPVAGIAISAGLIISQIKVNRAQFFPPALEYLDRANGHLGRVRFSFTTIATTLDTLIWLRDEGFDEGALYGTLKAVRGKVDTNKLVDDIARCHLAENLHDECTALLGEWAECDYAIELSIRQLDVLVGGKEFDRPELLRRELSETIPSLKQRVRNLKPRVEQAREKLRAVYFQNQRRLVRVGEKVAGEIDAS